MKEPDPFPHLNFNGKGRTHFLRAALLVLVSVRLILAAEPSTADREIRFERGILWVEDRLNVSARYALRDKYVNELFGEACAGKTNFADSIRALLEGEDLEVQKHAVKTRGEMVDIHVRQRWFSEFLVSLQNCAGSLSWEVRKSAFQRGPWGGQDLEWRF